MRKRVVRADQKDVPFPKMKSIPVRKSKKAKVPESHIQACVDRILEQEGISYMRLPSNMFRAIHANPAISGRLKGWILHDLSGWADNIAFKSLCEYDGVKFCIACFIENKTEIGKLHGKQKIKDAELGYNICRDTNTIKNIIKVFNKFHAFLSEHIKRFREWSND